jgi:MFS family permease
VNSETRFASVWYAHSYLRELVLIYPTYAIMMGEHGISPLALSTLFIVWSLTHLVLEVPSGTLADRYSRRRLLILSAALKGVAFLIWWVLPGFWGYLVGFVAWGMASSLVSGTAEALLHDTLAARDATHTFARLYGRGLAFNSLGVATALALGGYAAEFGYTLPLLASVAAPWLTAALVAVGLEEPPRARQPHLDGLVGTLRGAVIEIRRNPTLIYVVAMFTILVTGYGVLEEYIGPLLTEKPGFSLTAIGVVYASAFAARTVGMELAHRLPVRGFRPIATIFGIGGVGLALVTRFDHWLLAVPLAIYFAASASAEVLLQTRLQESMTGHARATVTSIAGVGEASFGVVLYLMIGSAAEIWSWHAGAAGVAALTIVGAAVFWLFAPPHHSRSETAPTT